MQGLETQTSWRFGGSEADAETRYDSDGGAFGDDYTRVTEDERGAT